MERMLANPRASVEKLERLVTLFEADQTRHREQVFGTALLAVQQQIGVVKPDSKNTSTNSEYATLYAVERKLRPIYLREGFTLSFNTADCPHPNTVRVLAYLTHSGLTKTYQRDVVWTTKGPKGNDVMTPTHAQASAESYGKRYLEMNIFHVTVGIDDDGNAAAGLAPITPADITELMDMAQRGGADVAKFCEVMGVANVAEITVVQLPEARRQLERKLRAKKKAADKAAAGDFPGDTPLKG